MVKKHIHLSDIKKCLNEIPDEELHDVTISHDFCAETCDGGEVVVMKWSDEYPEFFEKYDIKPLKELISSIQRNTYIVDGIRKGFLEGEEYGEEFL